MIVWLCSDTQCKFIDKCGNKGKGPQNITLLHLSVTGEFVRETECNLLANISDNSYNCLRFKIEKLLLFFLYHNCLLCYFRSWILECTRILKHFYLYHQKSKQNFQLKNDTPPPSPSNLRNDGKKNLNISNDLLMSFFFVAHYNVVVSRYKVYKVFIVYNSNWMLAYKQLMKT